MKKKLSFRNRRATYDYEVISTYVAGLQLLGSEVKSIRSGRVGFTDSYCYFRDGELFARHLSVQNLEHMQQHEPEREKKLLLRRAELERLEDSLTKGLTIVVLGLFEQRGKIKMEIALAKGKKMYDKRQSIKEKDANKEMNQSNGI